jgi:hypothetical protein
MSRARRSMNPQLAQVHVAQLPSFRHSHLQGSPDSQLLSVGPTQRASSISGSHDGHNAVIASSAQHRVHDQETSSHVALHLAKHSSNPPAVGLPSVWQRARTWRKEHLATLTAKASAPCSQSPQCTETSHMISPTAF